MTTEKLPTQQIKAEFDRLKIWQNRRPLFLSAIQRLTTKSSTKLSKEYMVMNALLNKNLAMKCGLNTDLSVKI